MRVGSVIFLIAVVFGSLAQAQKKGSIEGVWRLDEQSSAGNTRHMSQPSMYIFTKKHYSIIYVSSDAPRQALADISKATADELRSVFVESFVANAGLYDMKDGKISFWPKVAKSPTFMRDGSYVTFTFKVTGNTMTMTSEGENGYPVKTPVISKFTRIE